MDLPEDLFARYAGTMATYRRPWCVCGGWAVDAWLGRTTRDHGDFDITVFLEDQQAVFDHLADWYLIAHDAAMVGNSTELWDGHSLTLPAHLHARPAFDDGLDRLMQWVTTPFSTTRDGLDLDVQFNERDGDVWVLSREPYVARAMSESIRDLREGLPTATPEMLMFYKATAYWGVQGHPRSYDEPDFLALRPLLGDEARAWLRDAIDAVVPGHPWLEHLGGLLGKIRE